MVQMLKEDFGDQCKVCTRPFTLFKWKADRTARQKRTIICLTCARLKNCCQYCMLDLSFGLPITIRDAALKMIAPGPESSINREYYAQNHEREIEEGKGALEEYDKTDEKARELLKRLAKSEPYAKRRRIEEGDENQDVKALPAPEGVRQGNSATGPTRTRDSRGRGGARGGRGAGRGGRIFPSTAQLGPKEEDWLPPTDPNIKSLFLVGVEDDLPEYKIREFFAEFGTLQSVVCSHRSHCAYINYVSRKDAEKAADKCHGKAIIAGCPLRVTWGRPKQLDTLDRDQRIDNARAGRAVAGPSSRRGHTAGAITDAEGGAQQGRADEDLDSLSALAPPGSEDVKYKSLAGD